MNIELAKRISELRAQRRLTQEQAASELGISNKTLSKWETGASEPCLEMLCKLAKYYDTTADALLGLDAQTGNSPENIIKNELSVLNCDGALSRSFELFYHMLVANFGTMTNRGSRKAVIPERISDYKGKRTRSYISSEEAYQLFVNTDSLNMAVLLLGNDKDFSWLDDKDHAGAVSRLLRYLSDADALRLCALLHTDSFPVNFTADFAAKRLALDESRTAALLDEACKLNLCGRVVAHIGSSESTVYTCYGDGMILSIICLAHEYMYSTKINNYAFNGGCKMIGGKKQ